MRHSKRLGQLRWWNAVPVFLVAGGFTVIGIAGDTTRKPDAPARAGMPSMDGSAPADTSANNVKTHDPERAVVRHLPDESRRDALGRAK